MTAYLAHFGLFSEMIFGNGVAIRRIEQPGGSATYFQTVTPDNDEPIDIDEYMAESGDWYEVSDEEETYWMDAVRGESS